MPGMFSMSCEPPGPGTNSEACRSPPPAMSTTAPRASATSGDFMVMRFSGGATSEPVDGLVGSTAFDGSCQCSLLDSVPKGTVIPAPDTEVRLPAPSDRRSPAFSSIWPKGARSTPFCAITGASRRRLPPADSGALPASPRRSTVMESPARITPVIAVVGYTWPAFSTSCPSTSRLTCSRVSSLIGEGSAPPMRISPASSTVRPKPPMRTAPAWNWVGSSDAEMSISEPATVSCPAPADAADDAGASGEAAGTADSTMRGARSDDDEPACPTIGPCSQIERPSARFALSRRIAPCVAFTRERSAKPPSLKACGRTVSVDTWPGLFSRSRSRSLEKSASRNRSSACGVRPNCAASSAPFAPGRPSRSDTTSSFTSASFASRADDRIIGPSIS
ncbi:hypothetical protein D3C71_842760 [compost metagenome]